MYVIDTNVSFVQICKQWQLPESYWRFWDSTETESKPSECTQVHGRDSGCFGKKVNILFLEDFMIV